MQLFKHITFLLIVFYRYEEVASQNVDPEENVVTNLFEDALMLSDLVLSVEPFGKIDKIMMYETSKVSLSMRYKECLFEGISCKTRRQMGDIKLTFQFADPDIWALELRNESLTFSHDDILRGNAKDVFVYGAIIGFNDLEIYAERNSKSNDIPESLSPASNEKLGNMLDNLNKTSKVVDAHVMVQIGSFELVVVKNNRTWNKLFTAVLTILVVLNTINMGAHMEVEIIKKVLKKPIGPAVGFVSQFLVMPCLSFGVGYLLFDDVLFRLGLFVMGCCPGGNASNFWCKLLGGDINLSITMTTISTISALGMMPMWMYVLGSQILVDENIVIPYDRMIITLILLIGPVGIGVLIKYQWEKGAKILQKITTPFTVFVLLFNLSVGIYAYWTCFALMTALMVAAGFLIAFFGFGFGALFAWVFRLTLSQIIAVSIETAFQNGSIAFILLQLTLDDPKNDIATIAPIAQIMLTALPLWGFLIVWKVYQRFTKKKDLEKGKDNEEHQEDLEKDKDDKENPEDQVNENFIKQKVVDNVLS